MIDENILSKFISMASEKQVLVSIDDGWLDGNKRMNLHITVGLLSFTTMMFHFTTVYFFTLQLESLLMVGIFLWLWNLFAFLFDVPIWILQYYFKSKTLYAFWVSAQMVAMLIFSNFIFSVTDFISTPILSNSGQFQSILSFFLQDGLNILFLLLAAMCYGFAKEVNDITTISYVLNNAKPNQYKSIFAKNNIFFWTGSFFWLLIAWFILTFTPKLIVWMIFLIILIIFFIMFYFFDNSKKVIDMENIKNFRIDMNNLSLKKAGENMSYIVSKFDIKETLKNTKYIVLKPSTISKDMISFREIITKTKTSFWEIYDTLAFASNKHLIVYWSFIMLLTFWFWDTFASTFLIDFLNQVKPGWSFVLLGLIAIPAFWLQDMFWKMSDKVWTFKLSLFWLMFSGGSLVTIAFFVDSLDFTMIMILALLNSVGYAICMSLSVASFLESYNISYAERNNLQQIDANASAAPMKILQNLANVIGLFLGGLILWFAGFAGFFFTFGLFILGFLLWSFLWRKKIQES